MDSKDKINKRVREASGVSIEKGKNETKNNNDKDE